MTAQYDIEDYRDYDPQPYEDPENLDNAADHNLDFDNADGPNALDEYLDADPDRNVHEPLKEKVAMDGVLEEALTFERPTLSLTNALAHGFKFMRH